MSEEPLTYVRSVADTPAADLRAAHTCALYCREGLHAQVLYLNSEAAMHLAHTLATIAAECGIRLVSCQPAPEMPDAGPDETPFLVRFSWKGAPS